MNRDWIPWTGMLLDAVGIGAVVYIVVSMLRRWLIG